jgi:RNA polymerase sigma-70 factor (ECF subfamily)
MTVGTQEVWERFRDRLKGFVLSRVPDEQDADDILQDVFLKIHSRLDTLRDQDKLEAWLFQITRNAITEHYRHKQKAAESGDVPEEMLEAARAKEAQEEQVDEETDAPARLIRSCLLPMLEVLPDTAREALVMTEVEEITQKEMAERLGISFSGAKSRVQRAREKLKDVLQECCHVEFDRRGNVIGYELKMKAEDCRFCSPEQESM